jgi:hypothetical protein
MKQSLGSEVSFGQLWQLLVLVVQQQQWTREGYSHISKMQLIDKSVIYSFDP